MGRRSTVSAVAAAALLWAGAAEAKTFIVLHMPDGSQTLIDPTSIETEGPVRRTWTVTVRRNILDNGPPEPGYVRSLNEYDCARGVTRWRRFQAFSRTGSNIVTQENRSNEWTLADSSSEHVVALRVICGGSGGDAVISADTLGSAVVALLSAFEPAPRLPPSALDEKVQTPAPAKPPPAKKPPAKGRRT
jgi:hypothetical protein